MQNPPDNYYDHYPTIALARPVVLGGVPTAPYREVGHSLGALSGLPLIDLDHWLEHHFGSSLWEALHQRGEAEAFVVRLVHEVAELCNHERRAKIR